MYGQRRKRRDLIQGGNKLTGTFVTYHPGPYQTLEEMLEDQNHVVDAFTFKAYLITLVFAQRKFYVTVKNTEAKTTEDAAKLAVRRARKCYDDLGDIIQVGCLPDTIANRERLGLGKEFDVEVRHLQVWRNAA